MLTEQTHSLHSVLSLSQAREAAAALEAVLSEITCRVEEQLLPLTYGKPDPLPPARVRELEERYSRKIFSSVTPLPPEAVVALRLPVPSKRPSTSSLWDGPVDKTDAIATRAAASAMAAAVREVQVRCGWRA